jgi:muramoyltetrapeptide carboxypeptidase
VDAERFRKGCQELSMLGYQPRWEETVLKRDGYFAGTAAERLADLRAALADSSAGAVIGARGGYGCGYLLEGLETDASAEPRIVLGYSDLALLQIFLWQKLRWVTFYGPMVAAGFEAGAGAEKGYDRASFQQAVSETRAGWSLQLEGEALARGSAEGILLGGCLTLLEATLGTPWELDTRGAVLLLEDRGMKPYQVDRALIHLKQAGKLDEVLGLVLGDFPEFEPTDVRGTTVRAVCKRILAPLGVPVVYGAPVGHTHRPMLTVPLGIRVRLEAEGCGKIEFLEPAVIG